MADQGFEATRYGVVKAALAPERAAAIRVATIELAKVSGAFIAEPGLGAIGRYADAAGEALLLELQPVVERTVGRRLFPCYSFLRIYSRGAALRRHLDRPSCEYSTTLTLGFDADASWPIWVARDGQEIPIELAIGDMMVYKGAQVVHWRDRFAGRWWMQVFLHYVDADGDYAAFKFDGRERIGPFDPRRDVRERLPPATPRASDPCPCLSGIAFGECHGRSAMPAGAGVMPQD